MTIPSKTDVRIKRILKVNHAGEYGAIRIYNAQILISRWLYKDLIPFLTEMRDDEIHHLAVFRNAMPERQTRPCYTLWFWSLGGYVLGAITALLGRNMIMACTEAVEDAVHRHLNEQIRFLSQYDLALMKLIDGIKEEELAHLHYAQDRIVHNGFTRKVSAIISFATEVLIWLSTHGDSSRMKSDLKK